MQLECYLHIITGKEAESGSRESSDKPQQVPRHISSWPPPPAHRGWRPPRGRYSTPRYGSSKPQGNNTPMGPGNTHRPRFPGSHGQGRPAMGQQGHSLAWRPECQSTQLSYGDNQMRNPETYMHPAGNSSTYTPSGLPSNHGNVPAAPPPPHPGAFSRPPFGYPPPLYSGNPQTDNILPPSAPLVDTRNMQNAGDGSEFGGETRYPGSAQPHRGNIGGGFHQMPTPPPFAHGRDQQRLQQPRFGGRPYFSRMNMPYN